MESARQPSATPLRLALFLLLTLVAAGASPAAADFWYKHYDQAKKALAKGEWAEAVAQLEQALERKGDSGARVHTYGMNFDAYFPHLQLGIAYYELGQLDAALRAFETEEVLGAIAESREASAQLEDHKRRTREAIEARAAQEQQRIRQIVDESLRQAADREAQGQLDEALAALGRGLSVAPDDAEATAARDALFAKVAAQQQRQDREAQVTRWVEQGRGLLAANRFGEAAIAFQSALSLGADSDAQALLDTAQQGLRAELERAQLEQDAAERATAVTESLRQAGELEAAGDLPAALSRLQSVLALDPANAEALAMQRRILAVRVAGEQETERRTRIGELLAQAQAEFDAGRFEASLVAANQVLALDLGNMEALDALRRAYRNISRGLLGGGAENVAPTISFTDLREDAADGSRVQRVDVAAFQLAGLIVDESPVAVVFRDRQGQEVAGTHEFRAVGELYLTQFHLATRLPAGRSSFRLFATDEDGKESTSEYAVVYAPPFFRTPAFYGAAGGLVLALAGGALWRRHRRRQRLLKRRFNPYVAGAPVLDEDLFIGRDQLIERILQTVHNNSLLLYGERRIGKTSLQHHLKRRLEGLDDPEYDFFPVYVDLQGTPQEKFFATLAEDVFHELEPILGGLQPGFEKGEEYTHRDLVRDLRQVIRALKEKSSKKVKLVLLIDEVDELNEYDPRINQKLRSLFMKSFAENLVSVVSGVAIKKQWQREGSPWYNFFEEIEVQAFARDAAEELIERPIRGIFKIEDGLVDRIVAMTGGRPYLIQKLCIALVNRLYEQNRRVITIADVEALGRPEEA